MILIYLMTKVIVEYFNWFLYVPKFLIEKNSNKLLAVKRQMQNLNVNNCSVRNDFHHYLGIIKI